jgi:acyl-CoA synthetase (AMP-forming)/AMP-acid ligase II
MSLGATLCLPDRVGIMERLGGLLAESQASHVCATPALWGAVDRREQSLPHLEMVALGGESLPVGMLQAWGNGGPAVLHTYGVTEASA